MRHWYFTIKLGVPTITTRARDQGNHCIFWLTVWRQTKTDRVSGIVVFTNFSSWIWLVCGRTTMLKFDYSFCQSHEICSVPQYLFTSRHHWEERFYFWLAKTLLLQTNLLSSPIRTIEQDLRYDLHCIICFLILSSLRENLPTKTNVYLFAASADIFKWIDNYDVVRHPADEIAQQKYQLLTNAIQL